jgi:hypothetical protein
MPIESLEEFGNRWRFRALEDEAEIERLRAENTRLLQVVARLTANGAVTDEQLSEYEALARAATPGPWRLWRQGQPAEVVDTEEQSIGRIWQRADAEFIVAAKTAVLALAAEIRSHRSEERAAATLARECTDHAAVILWCADRVRSVDDSPAVGDAADYLHDLSTRAQVDTTPVTDRPDIIRWCAEQIHSMGGDADVERAAEYLDDLAVEAQEAQPACACVTGSPGMYEGPSRHCPVHGTDRAAEK